MVRKTNGINYKYISDIQDGHHWFLGLKWKIYHYRNDAKFYLLKIRKGKTKLVPPVDYPNKDDRGNFALHQLTGKSFKE